MKESMYLGLVAHETLGDGIDRMEDSQLRDTGRACPRSQHTASPEMRPRTGLPDPSNRAKLVSFSTLDATGGDMMPVL